MAAEIKVLSSIATREAYNELVPQFERDTRPQGRDHLGGHGGHRETAGGRRRGPRSRHALQRRTRRPDQARQDRGRQPGRSRQVRNRRRGERGRAEARHRLGRGAQAHAACRQVGRLHLWPERRLHGRPDRAHGDRRRDQSQSTAAFLPAARSAPSSRAATARSASSRSASSCTSRASTTSDRCRRTCSASPCFRPAFQRARRMRKAPRRWSIPDHAGQRRRDPQARPRNQLTAYRASQQRRSL